MAPPAGWTLIDLLVACLTSVVLIPAAVIAYRLFLHPLSSVPGPRLAGLSNVWHAYHVRHGRMLALGKTLHARYGPCVRVGPDEVWFDSPEAYRLIYGVGKGFEKSDFYLATMLQRPPLSWSLKPLPIDTLDLLSERDASRYRLQRRLIGPVYQPANIKRHEKALDGVIRRVVSRIRTLGGEDVDLKTWMHIVAVECLGAMVLGWSPGYLADRSDWNSSTVSYLSWRQKSIFGLFPLWARLQMASMRAGRWFESLWGIRYGMDVLGGFKPFFAGVSRQVKRRIAMPSKGRTDLLQDLIELHREKPEFSQLYLHRMAITNFGAGHDTLCSALTAIVAMLGTHPATQDKVAREISSADSETFGQIARLQYTLASIKEAQRLYPATAMSLPRVVPGEGLHLHGHYFPPGTVVGCNPLALHRSKSVFGADAGSFRPERWLGEMDVKAMERYNLTWGGGGRSCPGRHLAEVILCKVVVALVREFDIAVEMPPEEDVRFYFLAMIEGARVSFRRRGSTEKRQDRK